MNCQSGRKQILAPSHNIPRLNLFKNMLSYMNMQTTSGVAARDHGIKIVAQKIEVAAAGDRGELREDSCLAPSFGLAGFLGCSVLRSCYFGRRRRTNYDL